MWMTQLTAWLHSWTSGLWTHYARIHHSNALDLPNFISGSFEHYIEDCYIQIIGKGNLVDGNVCQPVVQIRVWSSLSQVQQLLPWDNSLLRNGILCYVSERCNYVTKFTVLRNQMMNIVIHLCIWRNLILPVKNNWPEVGQGVTDAEHLN